MTPFLVCTILWLLTGVGAAWLHLKLCVAYEQTAEPWSVPLLALMGTGGLIGVGWVALEMALMEERKPKS